MNVFSVLAGVVFSHNGIFFSHLDIAETIYYNRRTTRDVMRTLQRYSTDALAYWTKKHTRITPNSVWQSKLDKAQLGITLEEFFDNSCMDFQVMFSFAFGKCNQVSKEYAVRVLDGFVEQLDCKQHIVCVWMGDKQADGGYHLHGKLHFERKVIHPDIIRERWRSKHGNCHSAAYIKGGGYGRYGFTLHEDWDFFHKCPNRTSRCKKHERHECHYIRRTALPMT
tara:strand:- start:1074 stop:1745 length:672 start_codon:yes stop_codon:yes gene_type:complete